MTTTAPAVAFEGSKILILDFGSQYTQVIARRVRECAVYSQIVRFDTPAAELVRMGAKGIILSGGPSSVYAENAPQPDPALFDLGLPVLGICYGIQLMFFHLGGKVEASNKREYGAGSLHVEVGDCPLFAGLPEKLDVWNSHGDKVNTLPPGFRTVARTENSDFAAVENASRRLYGLQFHPEVAHTPRGKDIIQNFVYGVCGCERDWTMGSFIEQTCAEIREKVGKDRVILGLSGGVDSSVAAMLLHQAIGDQLTCVFVNNGLLRENEAEAVQRLFGDNFRIHLKTVDASERFLTKLAGVTDPEQKRKIIGNEFVRVSISGNPAALIKSHHNVGGLPEDMKFELIEPLRQLFKDEVRQVGAQLGLPQEVTHRQPFPGPGLAVRILGEVTAERMRILRDADTVVVNEMKAHDWYYRVWQSFAVLLPVRSVGVMGDERTYENTVALRIVESQDGMTADWVRLPYELLGRISSRICN